MRIFSPLWIFYKKLITPSVAVSILIAAILGSPTNFFLAFGIAFMLFVPLFQFAIYELNNPKEYYFYYNLGLSKPNLWAFTVILSIVIGLIFVFI